MGQNGDLFKQPEWLFFSVLLPLVAHSLGNVFTYTPLSLKAGLAGHPGHYKVSPEVLFCGRFFSEIQFDD